MIKFTLVTEYSPVHLQTYVRSIVEIMNQNPTQKWTSCTAVHDSFYLDADYQGFSDYWKMCVFDSVDKSDLDPLIKEEVRFAVNQILKDTPAVTLWKMGSKTLWVQIKDEKQKLEITDGPFSLDKEKEKASASQWTSITTSPSQWTSIASGHMVHFYIQPSADPYVEWKNYYKTTPVTDITVTQGSGKWIQLNDYESRSSFRMLSRNLPGMETIIELPCICVETYHPGYKLPLWSLIQHLNDTHTEWTRERIADWLDELHDAGKINIEFKVDDVEDEPLLGGEL